MQSQGPLQVFELLPETLYLAGLKIAVREFKVLQGRFPR